MKRHEEDFNPPAFPVVGAASDNQFNGMSLRDYFAARFMERSQSLCESQGGWELDNAAQGAYQMADAMLKARA